MMLIVAGRRLADRRVLDRLHARRGRGAPLLRVHRALRLLDAALVQGGNLLILLVGWGLVGLSSYLLIGFNQERPSAIAAAKKAFIINAVGDATMALALFLLIEQTGSVDFGALQAIGGLSDTIIYLVALGLLGGAVAKSAQMPLHTWLPDAMEGPTPVSALIHAATMVTAGVYLVARTHAVFELAPKMLDLVAIIGTVRS